MMEVQSGIVLVRPDRGLEETDDVRVGGVAVGTRATRGSGRALRTGTRRHRAHQLPDGLAGGRRTDGHRDRLAGAPRLRSSTQDPAPLPQRGCGGTGAGQAHWATAGRDASLAGRTGAGDRAGPAHGRGRQRGVDHPLAGRVFGASDWASDRDRGGAGASASAGLRLQTPDLESQTQIDRTSRVGKKRLRVEAILAAAASPEPPPIDELMPDPLLRDEMPEDLSWLLRLLPRADV